MTIINDFKQNVADFSKKAMVASIAITTLSFSGVGAAFANGNTGNVSNSEDINNTASMQNAEYATTQTKKTYSIVTDMKTYADPASLESKLEKYDTDPKYRAEVERLSSVDTEDLEITSHLASAPPNRPERYVVFWDAHLNTDIDVDLAISFGGMKAETASSTKHNDNIKAIIDCRDKMFANKIPKSRMLQFQKIRNCATKNIKVANDAYLTKAQYEKDQYVKMLANPEVDPRPLEDKLKTFNTDFKIENGGGPYYQAIKSTDDRFNTASMHYTDIIRLFDAVLNKNANWDDFAPLIDNSEAKDKEFLLYSPAGTKLDNNMGYLFKIRAEMLPENVPQDIDARVKLFDKIMSEWNAQIKTANNEYKLTVQKRANNVQADITPLDVKLKQYSNGSNNLYKKYQEAIQREGQKELNDKEVDVDFYANMIRTWHARLDVSMNLETFKTFEIPKESSSPFTALNEKSTFIKHNLELLFQCRDDIVGNTALADIKNPEKTYNAVNDCTKGKILENNIAWKAVLQDIRDDPYFNWNKNADAYRLINKAHTDPSVTAVDLASLNLDRLSDEHSKLEWNYQHVLDCRDEAIAKQKTITANDLTKSAVPTSISFDDVHECAGQRAESIYQAREDKIQAQKDKEHEAFVEKTKTYSWIFGGLALSIGGIVIGRKVHTAKKKAPKMRKN